jgi:hypothetical protein
VGTSETKEEVLIFITPRILPVPTVAVVPTVSDKKVDEAPETDE